MVSFQCEGCGDTLTKKKLDGHRNQCRNAPFTCLDCMTTFRGTDYKAHTSCVSEEQKYQGSLYKEKEKKSVKIVPPPSTNGHHPKRAYVEDAPDQDSGNVVARVVAPPEAPEPPPAAPQQSAVNVFDYLVNEETPNASKASLAAPDTHMLDYTPSILGSDVASKRSNIGHDPEYDKRGFSYGTDTVPSTVRQEKKRVEYITPGNKELRKELEKSYTKSGSADKKRKRHPEELDLTATRASSQDSDAQMEDVPAPGLHTGLTGGLTRLLSKSYSPTPDIIDDPPSPVKRTKSTSTSRSLVPKEHGRERSKHRSTTASNGALVKTTSRRTSDESRPRKKKRHRTHSSSHAAEDGSSSHHRRRHRTKAIEYPTTTDDSQQQLIVYKTRAEFFMSLISKHEDSARGMSVHKVLKRYHRERGRAVKDDEEKELFKGLRVKQNDRGEIVVFL